MTDPAGVRWSLVVPLDGDSAEIDPLLESIDAQPVGSLEIVFTDPQVSVGSVARAREWAELTAHRARIVSAGPAAADAWNAGMRGATGDWIGFVTARDRLEKGWLAALDRFATTTSMRPGLITHALHIVDAHERASPTHPQRWRFSRGSRIVDLSVEPALVPSTLAGLFFPRAASESMRFTGGIGDTAAAVFIAQFVDASHPRTVGLVADAVSMVPRSAAASLLMPEGNTGTSARLRDGLMVMAHAGATSAPAWRQELVLHELGRLFDREQVVATKAIGLSDHERNDIMALLTQLSRRIDPDLTLAHAALTAETRCLVLAAGGHDVPLIGTARRAGSDGRDTEIRYLFAGPLPSESFRRDEAVLTPTAAKVRRLDYFGQGLLAERILWLPGRAPFDIELNSTRVEAARGPYTVGTPTPGERVIAQSTTTRAARRIAAELAAIFPPAFQAHPALQARGRRVRRRRRARLSTVLNIGRRFANGWLLMDRVDAGGDNGELLYRYLRSERPDINAWFVVGRETATWARLVTGDARLIAYGSSDHRRALRRASVVASSHLDADVTDPIPPADYVDGVRPWRFVYLEHGVLQHDLSRWFNSKQIDILTTAATDEHRSIVDDFTPYSLTSKSVLLTGFPRHDAIAQRAASVPAREKNLILIAPTWRIGLVRPATRPSEARGFSTAFEQTDFGRAWLALLVHPGLAAAAARRAAQLVFLPHPNFRGEIDPRVMPAHVRLVESDVDVNELVARARCVVTDYSSIFFEAGIAGADVSYYQFDRDEYLNGGHTYVPGYWSYERHGFGPVSLDADSAVRTIERQLADEDYRTERARYRKRIARTLPLVDGQAATRITAAIERLVENVGQPD